MDAPQDTPSVRRNKRTNQCAPIVPNERAAVYHEHASLSRGHATDLAVFDYYVFLVRILPDGAIGRQHHRQAQ